MNRVDTLLIFAIVEYMNDTIPSKSDTIQKKCLFCGDLFEAKHPKAKYCSEACKQQVKRIKNLDREGGEPKTNADREFEANKPGYYTFSDTIRDTICVVCSKKFKTSLSLLKTCSVKHRDEMLRNLTGTK